MGTRREKDTGRRDGLGRRIKESFTKKPRRASGVPQRTKAEEAQRIIDEINTMSTAANDQTARFRAERERNRISESDEYFSNEGTTHAESVKNYHDRIASQRDTNRRSPRRVTIDDPSRFYTVEDREDETVIREHNALLDDYFDMIGTGEEFRQNYYDRIAHVAKPSDSQRREGRNSSREAFEEYHRNLRAGASASGGGGGVPPRTPRPPAGGASTPPPGGGGNGGSSRGNSASLYGQFQTQGGKSDPKGGGRSKRGGRKQGKSRGAPGDNVFGSMFTGVEKATGLKNFGSFRVTSRPRVGPFVFNLSRQGLSSLSLDLGPMRYMLWSRTGKFGFSSLDLPSGLSFRGNLNNRR